MSRFSTATTGTRLRAAAGLAVALVALRRLARRRRLQLAAFLVAGVVLGAGLMAAFADFGNAGPGDRGGPGMHRMADQDSPGGRSPQAEQDQQQGQHDGN